MVRTNSCLSFINFVISASRAYIFLSPMRRCCSLACSLMASSLFSLLRVQMEELLLRDLFWMRGKDLLKKLSALNLNYQQQQSSPQLYSQRITPCQIIQIMHISFYMVLDDYMAYDLAVNMIDNLTEEQPIIAQHTRDRMQKCLHQPKHVDIVRMPIDVYKFCKAIFKRQKEVAKYLLYQYIQQFYIKDVKQFTNNEDQIDIDALPLYGRVLVGCKDNVTVYLAQLFVRFIVLGLSVQVGEAHRDIVIHKTKGIVKELQMELVIRGDSFAEVMIKELEILSEEFACLEFYEGLRDVFAKCDTFHVQQWIAKAMEERRTQFQEKMKAPLQPKEANENQPSKKILKKKRVTINVTNFTQNDQPFQPSQSTVKPVQEPQAKSTKKLPSVSVIASKLRLSGGSTYKSAPKLPHRFVFRSSRKIYSQEESAAEAYSQFEQPSNTYHSPVKTIPWQPTAMPPPVVAVNGRLSPKEDSRVLCLQTPPRTCKKRVQ